MPPRFIARQLSHPSGFMGRLIMALMNRGNARLNAFALEQLAITATDHVLDIGFGGGLLIPHLLVHSAKVMGVDRSKEALRAAEERYADAVKAGRAEFKYGMVEALPLPNTSVDKVVTVNTIYFWSSLAAGMSEIKRVLRPGGRLAVGFWPKERMDRMKMPVDIFTSRAPADVLTALSAAGFSQVRIARPKPLTPWAVAVAEA